MAIDKKFEAFLARGRKMVEELAAELDTMEALAAGEATPEQRANRLIKIWGDKWQRRYRAAYIVGNRGKVIAAFKRIFKAQLDDTDIAARMDGYLASSDRFYTEARHSLDLFFGAVNKFSGTPVADDEAFLTAPVADCRHTPRCKSDQEHTRKRAQEMRA
jgi:hypothetical protein